MFESDQFWMFWPAGIHTLHIILKTPSPRWTILVDASYCGNVFLFSIVSETKIHLSIGQLHETYSQCILILLDLNVAEIFVRQGVADGFAEKEVSGSVYVGGLNAIDGRILICNKQTQTAKFNLPSAFLTFFFTVFS